jgi:hypothetical protein
MAWKLSIRRTTKKIAFPRRLLNVTIYWGIPMVCLELIGIPRHLWGSVLIVVIPATLVGVVAGALLEHYFVSRIKKASG